MKHLVILGGGITGLTAAFYINKAILDEQLPLKISLLEASGRLGGKIKTVRQNGFVIEQGPDSFLERKKSAAQLVKDVGLEEELVRNRTGQAYVLNDGQLYEIPKGTSMGIPTTFSAFTSTDLFSRGAKFRTALDLVLPRSERAGDQSVGNFFKRRLGTETVERLIEPLLSGIYAGNLDKLSLRATFPQFYTMEQKKRSLMLGMRGSGSKRKSANDKKQGQFLTLRTGLKTLVDEIEGQLPAGTIRKNSVVEELEKKEDGYALRLANGKTIEADAVISTVPHVESQKFLPSFPFLQPMGGADPTTVATVVMAFPADQVTLDRDGTGFVVSRTAGFTITACTWTHKKWPHTTPEDMVLLRCYVGKPGDEEIIEKSDEELTDIVLRDLKRVTDIEGEPGFVRIQRWRQAMPQYIVGHLQWLENLREQTAIHLPGLFFAGASYEGVGLPDCIDQGKKAAQEALQFVGKTSE
ncbi:MAG TPA: protoporphyrinogen oxidase [Bacillales bacterium]|nr:protoporphyrinogen oxidase [Bacillales bacterium]